MLTLGHSGVKAIIEKLGTKLTQVHGGTLVGSSSANNVPSKGADDGVVVNPELKKLAQLKGMQGLNASMQLYGA